MPDDVTRYSRDCPSPRYQELTRLYAEMHEVASDGEADGREPNFQGFSLLPHAETIRKMIQWTGARTVLDYGAGKGQQYSLVAIELPDGTKYENIPGYWGVDRVTCFDPGVPAHSTLPDDTFDAVVSTDVLEHCPEEDLPWIMGEMIDRARRFIFATIALYPASKTLPNGENAHCTLKSADWWRSLIVQVTAHRPELSYRFELHAFHESAKAADMPAPIIIEKIVKG